MITAFFCEEGAIELGTAQAGSGPARAILRRVHHVCASLADGRTVRLVVDVERPEVAFYVAQLLAREVGVETL